MKIHSALLSTVFLSLFASAALTACQSGFGVLPLNAKTSNEMPTSESPAPAENAAPLNAPTNAAATTPSNSQADLLNCPIWLHKTGFPLPKDDFEKQQGKPMCLEKYFQIRQLHKMVADLDRGVAYEDPNVLRFYDIMLFTVHANDRPKRDFGIEGRTQLVSEVWSQMLGSMKTEEGPCALEFRDGQMSLDLMRHGPIQRVDNEHSNPGNRFVMKSEDYKDPHWNLTCPVKTKTGSVEMKTLKQGKYFYLFLDVYENSQAPKDPKPTHMIQYLLSAS